MIATPSSSRDSALTVYAHLFGNTDEHAANAVESAMVGMLTK